MRRDIQCQAAFGMLSARLPFTVTNVPVSLSACATYHLILHTNALNLTCTLQHLKVYNITQTL